MSIQRPPPFTPQQRIDQAFESYPDATLNSWMRKMQQNPGYMDVASALRGPQDPLFAVHPQQLQHMAGEVVRPDLQRFMPGNSLSDISRRLDMILSTQPSGWGSIMGTPPANVLPITPDVAGFKKPWGQ